jgi:hypothetical protein
LNYWTRRTSHFFDGASDRRVSAAGCARVLAARALLPRRHCRRLRTLMMIVLLLFLQKQSLAFAVYLFGIGTLHTGPGLKKKHM